MSEKEEPDQSKHSKTEKPSGEGEKVSSQKPKRPRTSRTRQSNKPKSSETNSLSKEKTRGASVEIEPTTSFIRGLKGKRPIVGLTAYDTILGAAVSSSNVDFILVGDYEDPLLAEEQNELVPHLNAQRPFVDNEF